MGGLARLVLALSVIAMIGLYTGAWCWTIDVLNFFKPAKWQRSTCENIYRDTYPSSAVMVCMELGVFSLRRESNETDFLLSVSRLIKQILMIG